MLLPHLHTLLPYLKCDNGLSPKQETIVCLKITEILSCLVIIEGFYLGSRVEQVTGDLTAIALKYGAANIDAAVACLALLAEYVTQDPTPTLKLAEKCFESIHTIARADRPQPNSLSEAHAAKLQRCLIVFGSICEHTRTFVTVLHFENQDDTSVARTQLEYLPSRLPQHDINGACFSCCLFALELKSEALQCRALQALCSVFIGSPRLILLADSEGAIEWILSSHFSGAVHERFLSSLRRMMLAEEERLDKAAAVQNMQRAGMTTSKRVQGPIELDSDATIAGFVLQQHLAVILGFLSRPYPAIRLASLELIGRPSLTYSLSLL